MYLGLSPLRFVVAAAGVTVGLMALVWIAYLLTARHFFRYAVCPRCGSGKNRASEFPSSLDLLLRLATFKPLRCLSCGLRFYSPGWARRMEAEEMQPIVWTARYSGDPLPAADPGKSDGI